MRKVNIAEKFARFEDYWKPKIVGELNDSYVKLAKLKEHLEAGTKEPH